MKVMVGVIAAALLAAAGASGAQGPTVRLVGVSPATVAGSGFAAHARVAVSYRSGAVSTRATALASAAGTFRLALPHIVFKRCDGITLIAGDARLRAAPCSVPSGKPRIVFGFEAGDRVQAFAFVPGETVTVEATAGQEQAQAKGSADRNGRLSLRLSLPPVRCAEVFVRATGNLGSTATYTRPAPDCAAP
jgi:hypothetical protein